MPRINSVLVLLLVFCLIACSPATKSVTVNSAPPGAAVKYTGQPTPLSTPATIEVEQPTRVDVYRPGYIPMTLNTSKAEPAEDGHVLGFRLVPVDAPEAESTLDAYRDTGYLRPFKEEEEAMESDIAFAKAKRTHTVAAYERFISSHSDDPRVRIAKQRVAQLAWNAAVQADDYETYTEYLRDYENGEHREEAYTRQVRAAWREAKQEDGPQAYKDYLENLDEVFREVGFGDYKREEATERLAILREQAWGRAQEKNTPDAMDSFLSTFGDGPHADEATAVLHEAFEAKYQEHLKHATPAKDSLELPPPTDIKGAIAYSRTADYVEIFCGARGFDSSPTELRFKDGSIATIESLEGLTLIYEDRKLTDVEGRGIVVYDGRVWHIKE